MLVLCLLSVAVAVYVGTLLHSLLRLYANVWRMHRLTADMPGPPTYPFIGSILTAAVPNDKLYGLLMHLIDSYGRLFKFWLGPVLGVFVMEPEDVQVVLSSPHFQDKPYLFYRALEPFFGKGLISLNGAVYKRHRKAITSSLHLEILQGFMPTFNDNARKLVSRMEGLAASGETFNVTPLMGWCASTTVCETVLASEAPGLEAERAAFVKAAHQGMDMILYSGLRPWFLLRPLFKLIDPAMYNKMHEVVRGLSAFAEKVLARKMSKILAERAASEAAGEVVSARKKRRQTFLDQFLMSDDASVLNQTELIDELKTLLLGASATSMDFLSLFLLCMALEPEVQRKVQQELDDVLGDDDGEYEILSSDFSHLPYMESALKETLRYFAPVPIIGREASADVTFPGGQVIPKGARVAIIPLMVHRNPRHFPDPLRFDPERFSPEQTRVRHHYAFIPFSAGPRNCIGQRYGMLFAKTVAVSVLRRFDVLPDPAGPQRLLDVEIIAGAALTVKNGARVRVQRRADRPAAAARVDEARARQAAPAAPATPAAPAAPATPAKTDAQESWTDKLRFYSAVDGELAAGSITR